VISRVILVGHSGLEPEANGLRAGETALAAGSSASQVDGTVQVGTDGRVQPSHPFATDSKILVTRLLLAFAFGKPGSKRKKVSVGLRSRRPRGTGHGALLLTVREVAMALRVCTATVYQMVERGELDHVRVSTAMRIVVYR